MKNIKTNSKGVAGLDLALSVITTIFVMGLLIMIYALMGSNLQTASYTSTTVSVANETVIPTDAGTTFATDYRNPVCTITHILNTTNEYLITSGNYTNTGCSLSNSTRACTGCGTSWKVSYSVTYDADNSATGIMNDTVNGIADAPDWFPIVIVITFMVVLILLTVMIVRAVRGSGLMGEAGA
jgi:uncharacterized membrane protein YhdT